jgi:hypothetical protein
MLNGKFIEYILANYEPVIEENYNRFLNVYQTKIFVTINDKKMRFDLELTGKETELELRELFLKTAMESLAEHL